MRLSTLALVLVMGFPSKESGAGSSGVLSNPPWTQAVVAAPTMNLDGAGNIKASGIDASIDTMAYRNENNFNSDQYATATIRGGLSSGNNYAEVLVRCSGSGGSFQGYNFNTDGASGATHTVLQKWTSGAAATLTNFATTFATGDVLKISVVGNIITCYKNGAVLGSFTDSSSPLTTGAPGCGAFNGAANNVLLQNFEGGNVAEAYSVGTRSPGTCVRGPYDRLGFLKRPLPYVSTPPAAPGVNITPDVGSLVLDGCAPTIGLPVTVVTSIGQLTLTGQAPTFPVTLFPGSGALVLTGQAPTFPKTIVPGLGQLTLSGFSATFARTINPGVGSLTLSGFSPTFPLSILPGFGGLTLGGFAPTFSFTAGSYTAQPGLGALTLTGFGPTIGLPRTLQPGSGVLTLTGVAPAIGLPITVRPALGQLTLTGFATTISFIKPGVTPGSGQLTLTGYAPMIGTFTFQIVGGPVMTATVTAGGVLVASITGGPTLTGSMSGGPA